MAGWTSLFIGKRHSMEKGLESRLRLGALFCQVKDSAGVLNLRAQCWEGHFWLPYFRKCLKQLGNGARIHWW